MPQRGYDELRPTSAEGNGATTGSITLNQFPDTSSELSRLFDELTQIAVDQREFRLIALQLPHHKERRLRAMLRFDDSSRTQETSAFDTPSVSTAPLASALLDEALRENITADATTLLKHDDTEAPGASLLGTNIGGFLVLDIIGRGGSSIVFRAERAAGNGTQVVALKLLLSGLYTADAQIRFRREQSTLAKLTHPNIARLIEAGITPLGIPYIALEFVRGDPITIAADKRSLSIEQRLRWFLNLCRTVEAAHNALIVHRDLKPSNLYITRGGELKVLDFGIARSVVPDGSTETQSLSLTPDYAAPEQFRGDTLTTAIDVYSLGVILGELLTGLRLRRGMKASAALGVSGTQDSLVPKGLPKRNALIRRLKGDIDAVVLTAMAEDASRRYSNAAELANDIEHLLTQRPVRARPPSSWYIARTFLRRHRISISILALVAACVVGSLGAAIWQSIQARSSAHLAQQEAQRANAEALRALAEERRTAAVADFVIDLFRVSDPAVNRGERLTANEILDHGAKKVAVDFAEHPAVRARMEAVIGEVYSAMGDFARAKPILEEAIQTLKQDSTSSDLELGHDMRALAWAVFNLGGDADAFHLLNEAETKLANSTSAQRAEEVVKLQTMRAGVLYALGQTDASVREFKKTELFVEQSGYPAQGRGTMSLHNNFGRVLHANGDLESARAELQIAAQIAKMALGDNHPETLINQMNLGDLMLELGELGPARGVIEETSSRYRNLFGAEDVLYARMEASLGELELRAHNLEESASHYEVAERIYSAKGEGDVFIAAVTEARANVRLAQGRAKDALVLYDKALNLFRENSPTDSRWLIITLDGRCRAYLALNQTFQARLDASEALEIGRAKLPARHIFVRSLVTLAAALQASGDTINAALVLQEVDETAQKAIAHDTDAMAELSRVRDLVQQH